MAYQAVYGTLTATSGAGRRAGDRRHLGGDQGHGRRAGLRHLARSTWPSVRQGGGTGRQPGSTFKAILLAQMAKDGDSVLSSYPAPAGDHPAQGQQRQGLDGQQLQRRGLQRRDRHRARSTWSRPRADSVNTVFAQAVTAVGPKRLAQMGDNLGLGNPTLPPVRVAGPRHGGRIGGADGRRLLNLHGQRDLHPASHRSCRSRTAPVRSSPPSSRRPSRS